MRKGTKMQKERNATEQDKVTSIAVTEMFRDSIQTMRRFQAFLSESIACDPHIDEQERQKRLMKVDWTNHTLDEWEKHLELLLQEGMTRETQFALIVMSKQLRAGIEDF